jgi:hypothetical protein
MSTKDTRKKKADELPPEPTGDDTEGHNLFSMSDYYVQSKIGRQVDRDREARQRALVKEARTNKPDRR